MKNITVFVEEYGKLVIKEGSTLLQVSLEAFKDDAKKYLGARIENEILPLFKQAKDKQYIKFLTNRDVDGYRIYTKTISAVFIMACKELFPDKDTILYHFLGPGLYAELDGKHNISFKETQDIERKMKEIINDDIPIVREEYSREETIELFSNYGYFDKVRLIKTLDKEEFSIYTIGSHIDSFHGYLAPSTGYVSEFKLKYYYPGVIILFPSRRNNYNMDKFKDQKKLSKIFKESNTWSDILDMSNIGSLNEKIKNNKVKEIIQVSEALHEKKIAQIDDIISKDKDKILPFLENQLKNLFPDHEPEDVPETEEESTIWLQDEPLICKYEKRKGKPITIIEGYNGADSDFKILSKEIKKLLSVGGSFKNEQIKGILCLFFD